MDPATAVAQVIGSDTHVNASSKAAILASAQAGQMLDARGLAAYIPGTVDCSAVSSSGMLKPALLTAAGGIGLKFVPAVLAAGGPIAAAALVVVSVAADIFGAIFAHHAAAVQKEQSTLCAAVPAANQALQVIDEGVSSGQITPQDGISAMQQLPGQFQSQVSGIYQDCNAACVMTDELKAICLVKASQYQDLIAGAAQVVTAGGPNVSQPAGVIAPASSYASFYSSAAPVATASGASGDWLPIAALVIGGFFLLRSL